MTVLALNEAYAENGFEAPEPGIPIVDLAAAHRAITPNALKDTSCTGTPSTRRSRRSTGGLRPSRPAPAPAAATRPGAANSTGGTSRRYAARTATRGFGRSSGASDVGVALRLILFRRWGLDPAESNQIAADMRTYLARHLLGQRR